MEQYTHAEEDLIARLQLMMERDNGVDMMVVSSGSNSFDEEDDPIVTTFSTERARAKREFQQYVNLVKRKKYVPKSYIGTTLKLGTIHMGKVAIRGEDIKHPHPFIACNLATFIGDDGRFDLVSFLQLQSASFPTLYKLAVCLASIRTNEVGCERFFSTAGYVSCPRRTSLKVRNYECLATLKANIRNVFIDEQWVVNQYLMMEHKKSWKELDTRDDMRVLNLEREMMAESLGVDPESLPEVTEVEESVVVADNVIVLDGE
jgi:hAT family C-terminal dimerisation region